MIVVKNLRKEYQNVTPLKDVSVQINKGDVISVIGPSGTGKSTLVRCLNLLEEPSSGQIVIDGQCITDGTCDINQVRRKMGMVFQSFNLFHHLTIIENLMVAPVDLLKKPKQQAYDDGMRLLRTVGLADKALDYPDELSGGQQQRVAIARALAMEPEILLMDEPTSALDPTMTGEVQTVIRDLAGRGMTMMIVTHEMSLAREVANRVFYMDEGGIYEEGTPEEIFDHPKRERTIRFINRIRTFETVITSKDFDFIGVHTSLEEFGKKNLCTPKALHRVGSVFEELCMEIILPALPDGFVMQLTVECLREHAPVTMRLKYSGDVFDPKTSENTIALKIAEKNAERIEHTEIREGLFTNLVVARIPQ